MHLVLEKTRGGGGGGGGDGNRVRTKHTYKTKIMEIS